MTSKPTLQPRTPKGMRDFLPPDKKVRDLALRTMIQVFKSYGFEPLETPAVELFETMKGKIGIEEKLIYKFKDLGDRELALRYDQTIPLARVVAQYPELPKPFKRYQTQNVYRADNTQKGRYREFLQVDFDTVGSSSYLSDAEIIEIAIRTYQKLGLKNFKVLINSRPLLFSIIEDSGVSAENVLAITASLDKLTKIGKGGVSGELSKKGLNLDQITKLFDRLETAKPDQMLKQIFDYLGKVGIDASYYSFEPSLARGLDYYTGPIYEVVSDDGAGSIGSGGRYDNLIEYFSGNSTPAAGFSFGFDRTLEALIRQGLTEEAGPSAKVLVTIFNEDLVDNSLKAAAILRESVPTELYTGDGDISKQLKYADQKGFEYAVIIGSEEARDDKITLKNLRNKSQQTLSLTEAVDLLA